MSAELVTRIDALLPQTQCTKCGYAGCRPYAEALARGEAAINQCPPGGDEGVANLAALLGRDGVLVMPTMPDIAPLASAGEAGLEDCSYHNLSGGIVAVHRGYRY